MHRQPLAEPVTQETANVDAHRGPPQPLAHRVDPLQRADQHQLDQHDRIDRRTPHLDGVIRRASARTNPQSPTPPTPRNRAPAGTNSSTQTISTSNVAACPFAGPIAIPKGS